MIDNEIEIIHLPAAQQIPQSRVSVRCRCFQSYGNPCSQNGVQHGVLLHEETVSAQRFINPVSPFNRVHPSGSHREVEAISMKDSVKSLPYYTPLEYT